jgi:hypothetical protein
MLAALFRMQFPLAEGRVVLPPQRYGSRVPGPARDEPGLAAKAFAQEVRMVVERTGCRRGN